MSKQFLKQKWLQISIKIFHYKKRMVFLSACMFILLQEELSIFSYANNTNDLFAVVTKMLNDVSGKMLQLSTAAALIGVGTGAFFKKFSFGKADRIDTGNKLILNSIWAWVLLNGLKTILAWAGGYLGVEPEIILGEESSVNTGTSNYGGASPNLIIE